MRGAMLAVVAAIGLGSCVTHEVVALRDTSQPLRGAATTGALAGIRAGARHRETPVLSALVEDVHERHWSGRSLRRDPLPTDLAITSWTTLGDGSLRRADAWVESPRPWWQRFPADFVTDLLWPEELVARRRLHLSVTEIHARSIEHLDLAALQRGYANLENENPDPKRPDWETPP